MAFGMGGEVSVMGEVETLEKGEKVRCQWCVGLINVDVEVTSK